MLSLKPIGFRVLAEAHEFRGATNIFVPELAKDNGKYVRWVVVDVGQPRIMPAGQTVPIPVQIGDEVVADPRKCTDFPEAEFGKRYRVIDCDAIIATISGEIDYTAKVRPATVKEKLLLAQ